MTFSASAGSVSVPDENERIKRSMGKDSRRAPRTNGEFPVTLILRDSYDGKTLAGPTQAKITDISNFGTRLHVEQIRIDNFHLFYASQDDPAHILYMEINEGSEGNPITIPLRPIWFDRLISDDSSLNPFEIGAEFMLDANDENINGLRKLINDRKRDTGNWWDRLMLKIKPS